MSLLMQPISYYVLVTALIVVVSGKFTGAADVQRSRSVKFMSAVGGQHLPGGEQRSHNLAPHTPPPPLHQERMEELGRFGKGSRHRADEEEGALAKALGHRRLEGGDPRVHTCGVTTQADAKSNRGSTCPTNCPLFVHETSDDMHCSFRCVQNSVSACQALNPDTPVPDSKERACRAPIVPGCRKGASDGTDTCLVCKEGHDLVEGKCPWAKVHVWIWAGVFSVIGVVAVFVVVWIIALIARPIVNQEGLDRGLRTRSAAKLHMPKECLGRTPRDSRDLWPFSTNLRTTPIAGVGVLHLFNFESCLILWGAGVLLAWLILGFAVDTDFFHLGTRSPGHTPRDNCIIVAWGYTTQNRLMFAKFVFVAVLYVTSFLLALLYGVHALRVHQTFDKERISHKGFCARLVGLPSIPGSERVEDKLRSAMQRITSEKVLGVSICWDFSKNEDLFMKVIDEDTEDRVQQQATIDKLATGSSALTTASSKEGMEEKKQKSIEDQAWLEKNENFLNRNLMKWEKMLMSPSVQRIVKKKHGSSAMTNSCIRRTAATGTAKTEGATVDENAEVVDLTEELSSLYTTSDAFIVFETEKSRDAAVENAAAIEGGFELEIQGENKNVYRSKGCTLVVAACEPQGIQWHRITNRSFGEKSLRVFVGILCIIAGLLLWCFCFYYPYANSVMKADYANGTNPNAFALTMFGFIVIAGNALMYVICSEVADRVGFKTQAGREECYMLLYCSACVFNVVLDLAMAYQMAYKQQVGMGMRTYDGKPLGDITAFEDRFGTYAMQKSLGKILLDYSFPATFLIPFVVEPLVVIVMPYQIMSMIVRTHPSIRGAAADAFMDSTPMDLSRYSDVLLNVMLAVLVFFFPGGYVLYIFGGLVLSHLVIYNYDRLRVLYSIPACDFATFRVERCAQWLLSIPCGMLLACAVFKSNCQDEHALLGVCASPLYTTHICWLCFVLFCIHVLLHTFLLFYVVPKFGLKDIPPQEANYKVCAEMHPVSWFSANPVHCLRSQYIYEHDPPCDYFLAGYDYLLRRNEDLHLFYRAQPPKVEDYDTVHLMREAAHSGKDFAMHAVESVRKSVHTPVASREGSIAKMDADEDPDTPGKGKSVL